MLTFVVFNYCVISIDIMFVFFLIVSPWQNNKCLPQTKKTKNRKLKLNLFSKVATREQYPVSHPENPGYSGPDILVFTSNQRE